MSSAVGRFRASRMVVQFLWSVMARLKATSQVSSFIRITRSKTVLSQERNSPKKSDRSREDKCYKCTRRYRPGSRALKEIRRYQKGTGLLIPKLPFYRLARQVAEEITSSLGTRFTGDALESLQVAAEAMLVRLFEDSVLVMVNAKRVTLMERDLDVVRRIRGV